MKKQLFSLVMMLALVVLAGTSVKAQDGLSVATAYWHMPGSTHNVQVDNHADFSYAWAIAKSTCVGADDGAVEAGTSIAGTGNTAVITYSDNAAGVYRITVTETSGTCNTIRQFYTAVMNINVVVTSTLANGTDAAVTPDCNDYDLVGPTLSYLVPNVNADDGGGTSAQLSALIAASLYNERWVHVVLSVSDETGCPGIVGDAPAATDFAWQFNYTIVDGGATGTNFVDNFVALQPVTNVDYSDETAASGETVSVDAGTTAITIPLRSNIRWGTTDTDADQSFTFNITNVKVDDDGTPVGALDYSDGGESAANEANADNTSSLQYIDASPATSRITIND